MPGYSGEGLARVHGQGGAHAVAACFAFGIQQAVDPVGFAPVEQEHTGSV